MLLTAAEIRTLERAVTFSLGKAAVGLAEMTNGGITLGPPATTILPLSAVPAIAGGPEALVTAVYMGVEGDLSGHMLILFAAADARRLVDLLLDGQHGTAAVFNPLEISALAEVGNVGGSGFLNALADQADLKIVPTAPAVTTDMAGAILQQIVAELYMQGNEAVAMVETTFNGRVQGHFLMMPDLPSMQRLLARLAAHGT